MLLGGLQDATDLGVAEALGVAAPEVPAHVRRDAARERRASPSPQRHGRPAVAVRPLAPPGARAQSLLHKTQPTRPYKRWEARMCLIK